MISRASWSNFSQMDGDDIVGTVNRVLPPVVSLVLAVLIGWQIAQIVWMLVPAPAAGDAVQAPVNIPIGGAVPGGAADVNSIAAAHLFGEADADAALPSQELLPEDDLADTRRTDLTLRGVISSRQERYSVAVIGRSGSPDEVYAVGDSVGSGASLHAVYPDRVVLNESGALTNLKLPRDFDNSRVTTTIRRQTATTRQNANSIQATVANNLTKLTDVIRPTPYMNQGKLAGYRLYPGRNRKQFAELGLRPGDIAKDIDGQALTDPTQAMKIFESLGTAEQASVTIERNGQAQTLVISASQLDLGGEQTQ